MRSSSLSEINPLGFPCLWGFPEVKTITNTGPRASNLHFLFGGGFGSFEYTSKKVETVTARQVVKKINFKKLALDKNKQRFAKLAAPFGKPDWQPWRYHTNKKVREKIQWSFWRAGGFESQSILFLLGVWDPDLPASLDHDGFQVHYACQRWDSQTPEKQAFLSWARNPWWGARPEPWQEDVSPIDFRAEFEKVETIPPNDFDRRFCRYTAAKLTRLAGVARAMKVPLMHPHIFLDRNDYEATIKKVSAVPSADFFALHFALSIWNCNIFEDFGFKRLDIHRALASWNQARREVFIKWALAPWCG